ncbi:MAG: DegT/DnrJ/EryC1/StrS aminotransferase family protein [Chloroflexota bacterium]
MQKSIPRISEKEKAYVDEVLDSQFRTSAGGKMTKRLEELFAQMFNVEYAISFINGTATLHAALAAAGVGPGDEVIVPPLTMSSTSFAVLHADAIPVFADIDPFTWTISPHSIIERITPRTKAIIPVAIYGLSPDMDAIMDVATQYHLFVLEDDAQCFLGYYKGKIVGSLGHAASFSFQSSKHMSSGEGGMVTTNDMELANKIRRFNSLGYAAVGAKEGKITKETIQDPKYERHASVGWNYRMPELCAAVALGQLERLRDLVDFRIRSAALFADAVSGCQWLVPQSVPEGYTHSYWSYVLKLINHDISWYDFRRKYLEFGGDGYYAAWQLTYLEPAFRDVTFKVAQPQIYAPGLCPVAESIQPRLIQLKTNYFNVDEMEVQAEALMKTIKYFDT